MDLNKLSTGDKVIAGSGIVLLLFSFFPWFGVEVKLGGTTLASASHNGWNNFLSLIGILLAIVIVVVLALQLFSTVKLPTLPITWPQAYFYGGIAVAALVVLQMIIGDSGASFSLTVTLRRAPSSWMVAACRSAVAYSTVSPRGGRCCCLSMRWGLAFRFCWRRPSSRRSWALWRASGAGCGRWSWSRRRCWWPPGCC
jgi:hypothetical protein